MFDWLCHCVIPLFARKYGVISFLYAYDCLLKMCRGRYSITVLSRYTNKVRELPYTGLPDFNLLYSTVLNSNHLRNRVSDRHHTHHHNMPLNILQANLNMGLNCRQYTLQYRVDIPLRMLMV